MPKYIIKINRSKNDHKSDSLGLCVESRGSAMLSEIFVISSSSSNSRRGLLRGVKWVALMGAEDNGTAEKLGVVLVPTSTEESVAWMPVSGFAFSFTITNKYD